MNQAQPLREHHSSVNCGGATAFANAVAEREGFEPSIPCGMHAFQACALGLYATSPRYNNAPQY